MKKNKSHIRQTLKYFWLEMRKKKLLLSLVLFGFIGAFVGRLIIPLFLKQMFDGIAQGVYETALHGLFMILVIQIINWIFWRGGFFSLNYFETSVYSGLRETVFAYLQKHSFDFFNNNFSGSLTKKFLAFPKAAVSIFDIFVFDVLGTVISISFISVVLFWKNFYLGIGLVVWLVIVIFINFKFSKYKFKFDRERTEADSEVGGDVADAVVNYGNVKLFGGYVREKKRFSVLNIRAARLNLKVYNLEAMVEGVQAIFAIGLELGIYYYALQMWRIGEFTVGDFVLLQSYVIFILREIWGISNVLRRVFVSFSDADEMTEILETPHEVSDVDNAKELKIKTGTVEFKNVGFNYKQTRKIFGGLSLMVEPKQKIALIGPSGAGKSTLVKLLLRNYDLDKGKIFIDGQDIGKVTQESLWGAIGFVPQDPILFHRTLKENIAYGKEDATDEEIFNAAKLANCHQFIENFPERYETLVGERGVKLSGGERQRVAIARAILKNAPILVMDEATSSLDSESEKLIQSAIGNLMKNKTVFVIAHRLSTIKKMDRIIVVDNGKITEDGTHKSLLKLRKGTYRKLWELQAGGFDE